MGKLQICIVSQYSPVINLLFWSIFPLIYSIYQTIRIFSTRAIFCKCEIDFAFCLIRSLGRCPRLADGTSPLSYCHFDTVRKLLLHTRSPWAPVHTKCLLQMIKMHCHMFVKCSVNAHLPFMLNFACTNQRQVPITW